MKPAAPQFVPPPGAFALALACAFGVVACTTPAPPPPAVSAQASYVALLADPDGKVGQVQITTARGATLLDQPLQATRFAAAAGEKFQATQEKINQDFGPALSASPALPKRFLLYFQAGGAKLTTESEADLLTVISDIGGRAVADISVIGHTDTAGDADANERLGLVRAQFVAGLIDARVKLDAGKVVVQSHGEKNLLIPTPDNTNEPRNRRVEVSVR